MIKKTTSFIRIILLFMVFSTIKNAWSYDYPVAGLQPHSRPTGAPVIKEVVKNQIIVNKELWGIEPPLPPNIANFLSNQGNWFTPFSRPGMLSPYDLRNKHWGF